MIYTSKRPPTLEDLETPRVKLKSSATPKIKLTSSRPPTSRAQSRVGVSPSSSPVHQMTLARSCQASPLNHVQSSSPKIEQLVKKSLKKFKSEKKELAKIKKFSEKFKESHKEKLKTYNVQTRLDNQKFKLKSRRPQTACGSPEFKDVYIVNEKTSKRKTGFSSFERRANIGLEFYNLKSSRNSTPRVLNSPVKVKIERKSDKPEKKKKDLDEFMKKKRKERKRLEKEKKVLEDQAEIKRISELVFLEKKVKNALRKSTKGKPPRPKAKVEKKQVDQNPFLKTLKKKRVVEKIRISNTQDHEVQFILENGKLCVSGSSNRAGRECLIFGNASSRVTSQNVETCEVEESMNKRSRSFDILKATSSSITIVEPGTLSSQSSSCLSERQNHVGKMIQNHIQIRHDFNNPTEKDLNIDIGLHKLTEYLHAKIIMTFKLLKYYDPRVIDTPQLSEFPNMQTPSPEKSSQKEPLDAFLSQVIHKKKLNSRDHSEDLENIWDRIDCNSKNDAYLNNMDPLPPLTPIEDFQAKQSAKGSKRPSEEISGSITDQLKKVIFPSIEYLSFGNIGEVSHEDVIDSPSLLSIDSHNSEEPSEEFITFGPINSPIIQPYIQTEPSKPILVNPIKINAILIDDGSNSLSDYVGMIKESSSIATPEAEEVEEFSSIHFEFNVRKPADTSLNPFSVSEETLVLDEDEIIDKSVNLLLMFLYSELISEALYDDYKAKHFQLLGKVVLVLHEVSVRTGVGSVISFIEKVWRKVDTSDLISRIMDWTVHFETLGRIQGRQVNPLPLLDEEILLAAEGPSKDSFSLSLNETPNEACKVHDKMIFDLINFMLDDVRLIFNPAPWKTGQILVKSIDLDVIFKGISQEVKRFCSIGAGRIPSIAMVGNNGAVDDELLQKIREGGLAMMLASDISENEKVWTNYEIEKGQAGFDMADFILADLLLELENLLMINSSY